MSEKYSFGSSDNRYLFQIKNMLLEEILQESGALFNYHWERDSESQFQALWLGNLYGNFKWVTNKVKIQESFCSCEYYFRETHSNLKKFSF